MRILADTNILLRRTQPDHPSHTMAVESVAKLLAIPEPVYFTLQNFGVLSLVTLDTHHVSFLADIAVKPGILRLFPLSPVLGTFQANSLDPRRENHPIVGDACVSGGDAFFSGTGAACATGAGVLGAIQQIQPIR